MKNLLKDKKAIWSILCLATILRLVVVNQSFWHDEAITALAARDFSFGKIINDFIVVDNHTPLYYLLLRIWGLVFGFYDLNLRAFSVLLGVATVFFFYKLSLFILKDTGKANLATLLLSISPFHIYYSQEVRMYVLSCLFAVLSSFYFLRIEKDKRSSFTRNHLFFGIFLMLLMSSDYVPVFFLPVFWIYAILKKKSKKWWSNYIVSHIPLFIFGLLWLPIFSRQVVNYQVVLEELPRWSSVVGGADIKWLIIFWMKLVMGRISFTKVIYYPLVAVSSVFYIILLAKSFRKKNTFLILWFILPLILGLSASLVFPAFNYFRFLYVIPGFIILLFITEPKKTLDVSPWDKSDSDMPSFFGGNSNRKIGEDVISARNVKMDRWLVSIIFIINILGLSIYYLDSNQQREDWKDAAYNIETKAKITNSAIVFNYHLVPAGFRWYSKGYGDVYALPDEKAIIKVLDSYESFYYFDYLEDIYDPGGKAKDEIYSHNFIEKDIFAFRGVGQVRYYKR